MPQYNLRRSQREDEMYASRSVEVTSQRLSAGCWVSARSTVLHNGSALIPSFLVDSSPRPPQCSTSSPHQPRFCRSFCQPAPNNFYQQDLAVLEQNMPSVHIADLIIHVYIKYVQKCDAKDSWYTKVMTHKGCKRN